MSANPLAASQSKSLKNRHSPFRQPDAFPAPRRPSRREHFPTHPIHKSGHSVRVWRLRRPSPPQQHGFQHEAPMRKSHKSQVAPHVTLGSKTPRPLAPPASPGRAIRPSYGDSEDHGMQIVRSGASSLPPPLLTRRATIEGTTYDSDGYGIPSPPKQQHEFPHDVPLPRLHKIPPTNLVIPDSGSPRTSSRLPPTRARRATIEGTTYDCDGYGIPSPPKQQHEFPHEVPLPRLPKIPPTNLVIPDSRSPRTFSRLPPTRARRATIEGTTYDCDGYGILSPPQQKHEFPHEVRC
ncbi:hypothetical protein T492DRAFT_1113025 [Pavlovales sp. CCMP2436]|nr:hypothetical protein T492DRAFT_1113025 [Pavlovales sp. CCMP2436]